MTAPDLFLRRWCAGRGCETWARYHLCHCHVDGFVFEKVPTDIPRYPTTLLKRDPSNLDMQSASEGYSELAYAVLNLTRVRAPVAKNQAASRRWY
jgi:hypothetical protein